MALNTINGNIFNDDGDYIYKNIELTPNVFADVMIYLFNGKQFKRQAAIDKIVAYHIDHEGISHRDKYTDTFKKAAQSLANSSALTNVGYGSWRLRIDDTNTVIEKIETEEKPNRTSFNIDEILGEGEGTVYVYYYEVYKERALLKGQTLWECKVGMTDRNAMDRIFSQAGTAYPEYPHVATLIKCLSARDMESALHSILKLRRRWIDNAPGTEWFMTSPEEIKELYYLIMNTKK